MRDPRLRTRARSGALWIALAIGLLAATPVAAQDDRAAGLFTTARQLPLVAQSMSLRLEGGDAVVELVQTFANDGEGAAQADYRLHLPAEATLAGFGYWRDGRFLAAALKERGEAEAAHQAAASAGRATGIARQDGTVVAFSVYPLPAHGQQQVSVTLRLPVATERGRSHVRLPLDRLLDGSPLSCTVYALLRVERPLAAMGVEGASFLVRGRGRDWARLVLSSEAPVEIWWSEQGPPLLTAASSVTLPDGSLAVELALGLNDASAWRVRPRDVVLLVDGSFSMRRRRAAVVEHARRLAEAAPGRVRVVQVGEQTADVTPQATPDPVTFARSLLAADVGFHGAWDDLVRAAQAAGCRVPAGGDETGPRCVAVTDPQVEGLPPAAERELAALFLADADEIAYFGELLGPAAVTYQPGVDPRGRLLGFADTLVLPTLELVSLDQRGGTLERVGPPPPRPVAEGGLLRVFARSRSEAPLELALAVDGHPLTRQVALEPVDPASDAGRAIRHDVQAATLADWMAEYRKGRDPELRARIVELSLAEGIPTELTGLQVDDPAGVLADTATAGPLLRRLGLLLLALGAVMAWSARRPS
jgi:hypothetical protein